VSVFDALLGTSSVRATARYSCGSVHAMEATATNVSVRSINKAERVTL
jgi:hypothetical protein